MSAVGVLKAGTQAQRLLAVAKLRWRIDACCGRHPRVSLFLALACCIAGLHRGSALTLRYTKHACAASNRAGLVPCF